MKKATTMKKSSKEIVKAPMTVARKVQQPIKQPLQVASSRSGNARAPASNVRSATSRRARALSPL